MLLCLPHGDRVQQLGHSSSATAVLTVGRFSRRMRSTPRSVSHQAADGATSGPWHYGGIRPFYSVSCEVRRWAHRWYADTEYLYSSCSHATVGV